MQPTGRCDLPYPGTHAFPGRRGSKVNLSQSPSLSPPGFRLKDTVSPSQPKRTFSALKINGYSLPATAAAVLAAAIFAVSSSAQAPAPPPGGHPPNPAPTNLKVLPKDLTGD